MDDLLARQMGGQRLADGLVFGGRRNWSDWRDACLPGLRRGLVFLDLAQRQFELVDRRGELFRRRAELHTAQLGQLRLQLLDHQQMRRRFRPHGSQQRFQRCDIVGQIGGA